MTVFCRDCKHSYTPAGLAAPRCRKAEKVNYNFVVTGEGEQVEHEYCSLVRMKDCGMDGLWFEPKLAVVA